MTTDQGPWAPAQETFNKFARIDRQRARRLSYLSEHQARDTKLAFAIETGRIYGLRKQKYEMILKRELNQEYLRPPVEASW